MVKSLLIIYAKTWKYSIIFKTKYIRLIDFNGILTHQDLFSYTNCISAETSPTSVLDMTQNNLMVK